MYLAQTTYWLHCSNICTDNVVFLRQLLYIWLHAKYKENETLYHSNCLPGTCIVDVALWSSYQLTAQVLPVQKHPPFLRIYTHNVLGCYPGLDSHPINPLPLDQSLASELASPITASGANLFCRLFTSM